MSFRFRIIVVSSLIFALGFYGMLRWIHSDIRPRYLESVEESLVEMAHLLASDLSLRAQEAGLETRALRETFDELKNRRISARIYDVIKRDFSLNVYVTDENGIVIFDSRRGMDEGKDYSRWNDVYRTLRGRYGARSTRVNPDDPFSSVIFVAAPIVRGDKIIGVVSVSKPEQSLNAFLRKAQSQILWIGIFAAITVICIAALLSIWLTYPITRLTEYALAVRDGKRPVFPRLGTSEIAKLGQAFEEMRVTLEGKRTIEQFVQSLTHEIKSPLSAIRGAAELLQEDMPLEARRKFLLNIKIEGGRIQQIVDELLKVAALESRTTLSGVSQFDTSELVRDVIDSLAPVAHSRRIRIETRVTGGRGESDKDVMTGERFLVFQALRNLVSNAIDFSPEAGLLTIAVSAQFECVIFDVLDEGPGIPEFALGRVFEKFYSLERPSTGKKSSGLGLSFVKSVCDLHGGACEVANRNDRSGACVRIRLPRSQT